MEEDLIRWATTHFGDTLVMSSSFGAESALLISLVTKIVPNIPTIFIDTGYLFPETYQFVDELKKHFKLNLKIYRSSMSPETMEAQHGKLWETDLATYHQIRKIVPMRRALSELGAKAYLNGIRSDQTEYRSTLQQIALDRDGICVIHPLLNWTQKNVDAYFHQHQLPYHPLVARGYGSIGDIHTTLPGKNREGRLLGKSKECGLHIA